MQKGLFLIALVGLSQPAFPQALYLDDGCEILSAVIERSTSGKSAEANLEAGEFGLLRCARTAEFATGGFGRAMNRFSIAVRWNGGDVAPGDVCLSHRLSECYPEFDRFGAPLTAAERQFARDRWAAVQRAVGSTLRQPGMPDFSVFQQGSLAGRIADQLAAIVRSAVRPAMRLAGTR